jgi:hypothetical protein
MLPMAPGEPGPSGTEATGLPFIETSEEIVRDE